RWTFARKESRSTWWEAAMTHTPGGSRASLRHVGLFSPLQRSVAITDYSHYCRRERSPVTGIFRRQQVYKGALMPITGVRAEPIFGQVHRDLAIVSSLTFLTPDGGHTKGNYVLVRITDDAGRVGLGEASVTSVWSGETQAGTIALIEQELAPF